MQDPSQLVVHAADGRVLTGRSFGPATGAPVLFIAGAGTGKSMCFGEDLLDSAHVRLLTMDRPGMEGSDLHAQRTLATTVDDYRVFVEAAIGEPSVPVVANSQGSVFGLGAAVAGWASQLVLVSPADEVAHPAIQAMLPAEAAQLAVLADEHPAEAARVFQSFTPEAMEQMVLAGACHSDRALYSDRRFLSLYREALEEGFANGGAGYVRDTLIAMRPWALSLDQIRIPVTVLFGEKDQSHSPDHGQILAQRIRGARRRVIPGVGGALLWTRAQAVLEATQRRE
ncbi:alpha/beta hydrolase [Propionimicrobium sp. PCR01-08-3]|uniref:alpha/beta fold hydrolase n=1 Tax=Propionimicrobium sp. PCR01-08-3 TaxID=3052086 RepID=UPI00255D084B|nr:alpha/beta hydrolase [Propionimicrobium sp. PCR01-08-3]WIY82216.1 alpha/beta hydrolase [Propionimicrobium sp. PCR01-08-3]